jgi:hypothetical protein
MEMREGLIFLSGFCRKASVTLRAMIGPNKGMDSVVPDQTPTTAEAPTTSLAARLVNIYATPGDVFDEIRQQPEVCSWNWLVPIVLSCLVGVVFTLSALSQPNVEQRLREQQDQKLQKLIDSGKLSAGEAEAAKARLEQLNVTTLAKVFGSLAAVGTACGSVLGMALILKATAAWVLQSRVSYMKLVEVTGLTGMIGVLGTLVQLLLVILTGHLMATPGPILFVAEPDPQNTVHLFLASLNLASFWYLGVLALGLARVTGGSFLRAAWPLLGVWVAYRGVVIVLGRVMGSVLKQKPLMQCFKSIYNVHGNS